MARESVVDETGTSVETEEPTVEVASEVAPEDTTATGIHPTIPEIERVYVTM